MTSGANREALRGHLELLVLAVLEREESSGADVRRRLRELSDGRLNLADGTLYPALYRLREAGLVTSRPWRPRRPLYRLTTPGKAELVRRRQQWHLLAHDISAVLDGPPRDAR